MKPERRSGNAKVYSELQSQFKLTCRLTGGEPSTVPFSWETKFSEFCIDSEFWNRILDRLSMLSDIDTANTVLEFRIEVQISSTEWSRSSSAEWSQSSWQPVQQQIGQV